MLKRIIAIVAIFVCTAVAWAILGSTIFYRTYNAESGLAGVERDGKSGTFLIPTKEYDAWLAEPPAARLVPLVTTWWTLPDVVTWQPAPDEPTLIQTVRGVGYRFARADE